MRMVFQKKFYLVPFLTTPLTAPAMQLTQALKNTAPMPFSSARYTRHQSILNAIAPDDMRCLNLPPLHASKYPLEKIATHTHKCNTSLSNMPVIEFNHDVAEQLIEDVNQAILWLLEQKKIHSSEQERIEQVQTKIINIIDYYAAHYWLPLTFERLTSEDWLAIGNAAAENQAAAHFLSLLVTQLCYCSNSSDRSRVNYAIKQMKAAGIAIDPMTTTHEHAQFICHQHRQKTLDPHMPIIGYLLRHHHKDSAKSYWIVGLAGIQTVTMRMNIQASVKTFLVDNRHWGYNEYYQKIVNPSFSQVLESIQTSEDNVNIPATVHFSGHSMGGVIAHFAALNFPPNQKSTPKQKKLQATKTKLIIHSNNSVRAGNHQLEKDINAANIGCITSTHSQDIVNSVPPDFLGYSSRYNNSPPNRSSLKEAADIIKLFGKNWKSGFVQHRLAVFILMYVPENIRPIFIRHMLTLPLENHFDTLGYSVKKSN